MTAIREAVPVARGSRVAFVLQGGGSLAATQVGMLRALTEAGIRPDLLVGTSAGALNAVMFATDPTLDGVDRLEALWHTMNRRAVTSLSPRTVARAVLGRGASLSTDDRLRALITGHVRVTRLDETVVPVAVVATDADTGEPVVLRDTPVVASLLASAAFPGLYPPVSLDGRVLVDGGVVADVPVLQAEALGATACFVLPCAGDEPVRDARPSLLPMTYRALGQVLDASARYALAAAHGAVHVLPAPASSAAHPVDFRDTARLIEQGYALARQDLARLRVVAG